MQSVEEVFTVYQDKIDRRKKIKVGKLINTNPGTVINKVIRGETIYWNKDLFYNFSVRLNVRKGQVKDINKSISTKKLNTVKVSLLSYSLKTPAQYPISQIKINSIGQQTYLKIGPFET